MVENWRLQEFYTNLTKMRVFLRKGAQIRIQGLETRGKDLPLDKNFTKNRREEVERTRQRAWMGKAKSPTARESTGVRWLRQRAVVARLQVVAGWLVRA